MGRGSGGGGFTTMQRLSTCTFYLTWNYTNDSSHTKVRVIQLLFCRGWLFSPVSVVILLLTVKVTYIRRVRYTHARVCSCIRSHKPRSMTVPSFKQAEDAFGFTGACKVLFYWSCPFFLLLLFLSSEGSRNQAQCFPSCCWHLRRPCRFRLKTNRSYPVQANSNTSG